MRAGERHAGARARSVLATRSTPGVPLTGSPLPASLERARRAAEEAARELAPQQVAIGVPNGIAILISGIRLDARPRGIAAHVRARLDVPLLLDADQHAFWSDHQPAPHAVAF